MSALTLRTTLRPGIARAFMEHMPILAIVATYFVSAIFVAHLYGIRYSLVPNLFHYLLLLSTPLVLGFCLYTIRVMIFVRPDRLSFHLVTQVKKHLIDSQSLTYAIPIMVMFPFFGTAFTFYKSAIPIFHPYDWDARLSGFDVWLHGGTQPWVWLQPLLGHPLVTSVFNFCYILWFFFLYAILIQQAFDTRNKRLRTQFYLSFVLTWIILGSICATLFASLGPCYDAQLAHNTGPYAPLMAYLQQVNKTIPVWALDAQQMLWRDYQHNQNGLGSGISAMPSVHVATATLMALFGWQYARRLGIALTVFAVIIFLGSIHLGWHYAVDGYAAVLGTLTIWWLVGVWQVKQ